MKQFRADLHIHSRFSRATSKKLSPRYLAAWSRIKGLDVLGTGDFTHPEWLNELEEQLVQDSATGLFRLKDDRRLDHEVPEFAGTPFSGRALFMLQGEISSIYKRGGKVRKVHNLVFMPTIEAARTFSNKLAEVGNITSDGRPILGWTRAICLKWCWKRTPSPFLFPPISGRRGSRCSVPNPVSIPSRNASAIFRPKFLRWRRAFLPILK